MRENSIIAQDGVRLFYRVEGPEEGEPVMLVHGLASSGRQFADDAAYFAALSYRVIVPDLRGHDRSDLPQPCVPEAFGITTIAGDLLAVLDAEGMRRVHWVGNSLGGIVGLSLCARAPERLASFASFGTAYRLDLPMAAARAIPLAYKLIGRRRIGCWGAALTTRNTKARPLVAKILEKFDPQVGFCIASHVRRYDFRAAAQGFAGPMLLIRGERDRLVNQALPETFAAMAGRANFRRVDLAEGGHCANLDVPEQWRAALVAFWREC